MKSHNMTLKQPYFDLIKNGKKTIELRLYDTKRQQIAPGDEIIFQNGDNSNTVVVVGLVRARCFASLFDIIDVKETGLEEREKAISIMEQFYDQDAQNKFGVVGIVVKNKRF